MKELNPLTVLSLAFIASIPYYFIKAGQYSKKIDKLNSSVKLSPTLINNYAIGKSTPTLGIRIVLSN